MTVFRLFSISLLILLGNLSAQRAQVPGIYWGAYPKRGICSLLWRTAPACPRGAFCARILWASDFCFVPTTISYTIYLIHIHGRGRGSYLAAIIPSSPPRLRLGSIMSTASCFSPQHHIASHHRTRSSSIRDVLLCGGKRVGGLDMGFRRIIWRAE